MKTVTAREANQAFSKLLNEAASGTRVVITRRGKPVAELVAYRQPDSDPDRTARIDAMVEMMRRGVRIGYAPVSRDEMHER